MLLSINRHLTSFNVYDQDHRMLYKIKSLKFFGPEYGIYNSKGERIYTTDVLLSNTDNQAETRKYVAYASDDKTQVKAMASLEFEKPSLNVLYKLPPVARLYVKTNNGAFQVKHMSSRKVSVIHNKTEIGDITFLSFLGGSKIHCSTAQDDKLMLIFFVLSLYMVHEDDLPLV